MSLEGVSRQRKRSIGERHLLPLRPWMPVLPALEGSPSAARGQPVVPRGLAHPTESRMSRVMS